MYLSKSVGNNLLVTVDGTAGALRPLCAELDTIRVVAVVFRRTTPSNRLDGSKSVQRLALNFILSYG